MAGVTVQQTVSTFSPMSFAQARSGRMIAVNGIDPGFMYDGKEGASVTELGIFAPTAAPTGATPTSPAGGASAGTYIMAYRYIDDSSPTPYVGNLSPTVSVTALAGDSFTFSGVVAPTDVGWGLTVQSAKSIEFWRSTVGQSTTLYKVGTLALNLLASKAITATDDSGGFVRFTIASADSFLVGQAITVTGHECLPFNTEHTITAVDTGADTITTATAWSDGEIAITTVDDDGGFARINVGSGDVDDIDVGENVRVTGVSGGAYNTDHGVTGVDAGNDRFTTDIAYTAPGTGGVFVPIDDGSLILSGFNETNTDDTLLDNAASDPTTALRLNTPDGRVFARRHDRPPNHTPIVIMFQDRAWYTGRVIFNRGTITTVQSDATIEGSGTIWPTDATGIDTFAGRIMTIFQSGSTYNRYTISSITDKDTLELTEAITQNSASGLSYEIAPTKDKKNLLYYSEVDLPESVPVTNVLGVQESTGDDDEITGLIPHGPYMYILKERNFYRLSFFSDPAVDASITHLVKRGCINQRCWARYEETIYLMDQAGIYKFMGSSSGGGSTEQISMAIQDIFRDGTIDWANSKWFFTSLDEEEEIVRFHVGYTADSSTRPKRWLEYDIRSGMWTTGQTVEELGGATTATFASRRRVLVGGEMQPSGNSVEHIYLFGEGTSDHVTTATRGTATAGTSTTLTDDGATFVRNDIGAPLAIVAGTGARQLRKVTAVDNGDTSTVLTVDTAWTTTPDATSVYVLGAIPYEIRTGKFDFVEADRQNPRHIAITYDPTTNDNTMDIRRYHDHDASVENFAHSTDRGRGVVVTKDDPNAVVDLKLTRSSKADAIGYERLEVSGRLDPDGYGPRYVTVELKGYQGEDAIVLHRLDIEGVMGGEG